uniref:Uncharacterized protein n=1 Tax=Kalanchoe fedtschenkoi TaxID=63787 RepID=A0A7N0TVA0_KALFE
MATTRRRPRLKWQPLAPPAPRVLNFPRHLPPFAGASGKRRTKRLEVLFDEEREFGKDGMRADYDYNVPIVVLNSDGEDERPDAAGVESEMLRAECRFLRMEREVALKKVRRNRARMERLHRSALQTLISGRDKMRGESGSVCDSLDDEIEAMRCKLVDLQRVSGARVFESHHRNSSWNFDDQDSNFQSRLLVPYGNQIPREIQELAEASLSIHSGSAAEQSIGESSRSTDDGMADEERRCSGSCRAVVWRIVEEVRIEMEQWSQMQGMLEKVKEEMGQLQASRSMWEQRALDSDNQITALNSTVQEWKEKAFAQETKVNSLQTQAHVLQRELKMLRDGAATSSSPQTEVADEKEKRVVVCLLKENQNLENANNKQQGASSEEKKKQRMRSKRLQVPKRPPFRDIGNSSPLMRQIANVVFPGHRR